MLSATSTKSWPMVCLSDSDHREMCPGGSNSSKYHLCAEDVQRFEEELDKYKKEHPLQLSSRRKAHQRKPASRPKAPLTAWRAFVQRELLKRVDSAPEKQGHISLQNQVRHFC